MQCLPENRQLLEETMCLHLVQSDDTLLHLTACKDVLKEAFPDLATMSEATLAELILEKESITITYHTTNRTIKKLITEK